MIQPNERCEGEYVAIADGTVWQGERGEIVKVDGLSLVVRLDCGLRHRVLWWKDVQLVQRSEG